MLGGSDGSKVPADYVVQFGSVDGSSLGADTGSERAVLYSVSGAGPTDEAGETDVAADVFGALGVVGRPLPPKKVRGRTSHADVVCLRTADGLIPVAARDLRLRMGGDGPAEGTIAVVGYGGGFHSLDAVLDGDDPVGTLHVIYCPYDLDGDGIPQKAHVITLDPTSGNESISIVHAEGMAMTMSAGGNKELLLKNAAGDATLRLDDNGITLTATTITLSGGVILGQPSLAMPLLAGIASLPSTMLHYSP